MKCLTRNHLPPLSHPTITMATLSVLVLAIVATVAQAQSLTVINFCSEAVFLSTGTSYGTINNNVNVAAGRSANLGISSNWDGAINVGKCVIALLTVSDRATRNWMQQRWFDMYHWWPYLGR